MTCLNKIIAGLNLRHGGRNVRQRTKRNKNILIGSAGAIGLSSVTSRHAAKAGEMAYRYVLITLQLTTSHVTL